MREPENSVQTLARCLREIVLTALFIVAVIAVIAALQGCAHALGYAGENPGGFICQGKGTVNFSGQAMASAVFGGAELNGGSVTADCSPTGFTFFQGKPSDFPAISTKGGGNVQ